MLVCFFNPVLGDEEADVCKAEVTAGVLAGGGREAVDEGKTVPTVEEGDDDDDDDDDREEVEEEEDEEEVVIAGEGDACPLGVATGVMLNGKLESFAAF